MLWPFVGGVVRDGPGRVERVRAEGLVPQVGRLGGRVVEEVHRRRVALEQRGIQAHRLRDPAGRRTVLELPMADIGRGQIVRHRMGLVPDPGPLGTRHGVLHEVPVRDHLEIGGNGHPERPGCLVARMVVQRDPGRRRVGLVAHERPVVGVDEAIGGAEDDRRADDRLGHAAVADFHDECGPVRDHRARRDDELLAIAGEAGLVAVHVDRVDRELLEVEVEAGQVLRRRRRDLVAGVQPIRRRVVREGQVVVLDVIAAVSLEGEYGSPIPGAPGLYVWLRLFPRSGHSTRRTPTGSTGHGCGSWCLPPDAPTTAPGYTRGGGKGARIAQSSARVPTASRYSFSKRARSGVPRFHSSANASSVASNSAAWPCRSALARATRVGP